MDIEFHYYMTFIVALRAGFASNDAYVLAYSSQHTDDNTTIYKISQDTDEPYSNYISQTSNILKPDKELMRIYPIFHFMPGTKTEIECDTASRKDGKFHVLNTMPDNEHARSLLKAALATKDLFRIGIAAHMYADTFAHQNFVGYYETFNSMKGLLEKAIPDVGHAEAKHSPDLPALIWEDTRLIRKNSEIDNKERFLKAAGALFVAFRKYLDPTCDEDDISRKRAAVVSELEESIGDHDKDNEERANRIARYKKAIGKDFKEYDEDTWFDAAVKKSFLAAINPWATFTWKPNFPESNWYRFQQAVKAHQAEAMTTVLDPITHNLELERI
jgi:hypothetical protein